MIVIPQWLIDWLKESLHRFKMKRPLFFRNISRAADILLMLCGIPYVLHQSELIFDYKINDYVDSSITSLLEVLSNKLAIGIGIGMKLAASLTVKTIPVAQTEEGRGISVTDEKTMPFTAKAEAKEMLKQVPEPPVSSDVPEPGNGDSKGD